MRFSYATSIDRIRDGLAAMSAAIGFARKRISIRPPPLERV
jgi:hypothetical protein